MKMTTVRIPGTDSGKTTDERREPRGTVHERRVLEVGGIVAEEPMRSQIENGTVNVGKTRMKRPQPVVEMELGDEA